MTTTGHGREVSRVWEQFNRDYRSRPAYFGGGASRALLRSLPDRPRPLRVLDLGSGPGRNALALARRGCTVTAVDMAEAAVRQLNERAGALDLPVTALCRDVRTLQVDPASYHMVVSTTVLGHIERAQLPDLCRRIVRWLKPHGLLFAEEFSTADPGCELQEGASECAELVKHYFAPGEMEDLFAPLKPAAGRHISVTDDTHGDRHRHDLIRLLARKPS